jgi:uncharacterized membrane protein
MVTETRAATLSVLKFPTAEGAEQTLHMIQDLAKQQLITLQDAAIVTWPLGKKKPKTKQLGSMAGIGALGGAFWGMLFGLIFFVPFLGIAIGAAIGAIGGSMAHVGEAIRLFGNEKTKVKIVGLRRGERMEEKMRSDFETNTVSGFAESADSLTTARP